MGPSGSGKSTLLSILAGLLRPSSGSVELCGQAISGARDAEVRRTRREHLGFVFQADNLFAALTALENVAEILAMRGAPRPQTIARAREALERVQLGDRLHHRPTELSGGERQRVAIARAFAANPALLLCDEPTAALDSVSATTVMRLLRDYVGPQRSVLLVTHDSRLERFADRVIELVDGRIQSDRRHAAAAGQPT
jgi:putative ABC transport system ATP-binding protein